jgi:hypothetical protein
MIHMNILCEEKAELNTTVSDTCSDKWILKFTKKNSLTYPEILLT